LGWERTHDPAFFRLRRAVSAVARDTNETQAAEKVLLAYVNDQEQGLTRLGRPSASA